MSGNRLTGLDASVLYLETGPAHMHVASPTLLEGPAPERMHEDLAPYRTWAEVQAEADKGNDQKLAMLTRMVKRRRLGEVEARMEAIRSLRAGA